MHVKHMHALTKSQQNQQARLQARAELFRACGIDFEEQARLLGRAIKKLSRGLHARKLEVVVIDKQVQRVMVPDNPTQIRCAEKLSDLFAGDAKQLQQQQDPVTVQIVFPGACQPPVEVNPPMMITQVEALSSDPAPDEGAG